MSVYSEKHPKTGKTRWRVDIVWEYPDGSTKRIRKVSPVNTRRGAEQYERDTRNALADGTHGKSKSNALTLSGFRDRYFDDHVAKMKPSSRSAQDTIFRISLLPMLGDMPLGNIDEEAIARLTGRMLKAEAAPKTINNALSVLRTALTQAHDWKLIRSVPRFRWVKVPQQKFDFFSVDDTTKIIAVGSPMVTTAIRTGMRIGELLALKWSDVSLERNHVTVERSVFWEREAAFEGGTKSGKVRTIPLTSEVRAALVGLAPHARDRKGYVFVDDAGEQLTRNESKSRLWPVLREAGVRRTGWHVCRHSFASHLVAAGVPLPAVQQLMGHSTIQMTMKYAHLAPDHLRTAMAALEPLPPSL